MGADFRGYEKDVWEKVELARREGRVVGGVPAGLPEEEEEVELPAGLSPEGEGESPVAAADPSTAGLFCLTIRGSATQSLNLAVKPTVLLSTLLGQYCKKFTIAPERQGKMWLEFDGERLDGKMKLEEWAEESGFEDEECIEVGEAKG